MNKTDPSKNLPTDTSFLKHLNHDILDIARDFSEKHHNQSICVKPLNGALGTTYFTGNHQDALKIMKTTHKTEKVINIFKPVFGNSVFNQQSDQWEAARKKFPFELLPPNWFHDHIPIFKQVIHKTCSKYMGKRINLLDFSRELVVAAKMKMTFGLEFDQTLLDYLMYQQPDINRQLRYNFPPLSPWFFYGRHKWNKEMNKHASRKKPCGPDLLSYLFENGHTVDQTMKDELNAIFWGGITSFVSTVCLSIVSVKRDRVQEYLVRDDQSRLNATAAFKETLRMYPGAPLVIRKLKNPLEISGCPIKKNDSVVFCPYISQNDKKDWHRPTKFDLRRHLSFEEKELVYKGFMPFGVIKDLGIGGRGCAGYKFVMVLGPLILKTLVDEYDLRIENLSKFDEEYPVKSYAAAIVPKKEIFARLNLKSKF